MQPNRIPEPLDLNVARPRTFDIQEGDLTPEELRISHSYASAALMTITKNDPEHDLKFIEAVGYQAHLGRLCEQKLYGNQPWGPEVAQLAVLIQDLTKKVDASTTELRGDIAAIRNDMTTMHTDMNTMHTDLTTMHTNMTAMRADMQTLKADIGTLRADVGTLKADVGTLKADVGTLKADVGTLKADVGQLQNITDRHTALLDI